MPLPKPSPPPPNHAWCYGCHIFHDLADVPDTDPFAKHRAYSCAAGVAKRLAAARKVGDHKSKAIMRRFAR